MHVRGPVYAFQAYTEREAKRLGLISSQNGSGTHLPITTEIRQGEGKTLADLLRSCSDAILIRTPRKTFMVYRPKSALK